MQDDLIWYKSEKEEFDKFMENFQAEKDKMKRERHEFELIAMRTKHEKQKVRESPARWYWQVLINIGPKHYTKHSNYCWLVMILLLVFNVA